MARLETCPPAGPQSTSEDSTKLLRNIFVAWRLQNAASSYGEKLVEEQPR